MNNLAAGDFIFNGPQPDLTASNLRLTSTSVSYRLNNIATVAVAASITGIYLSADNTIPTADTLLTTVATPALGAGSSDNESTAFSLPTNLTPGTYYIGVLADYNAQVSEADDNNNGAAVPIILGNDNINSLAGTTGDDTMFAFAGNDTLTAGNGNDWIDGGAGDDILLGGIGTNTLIGGTGFDVAIFDGPRGSYAIGSNTVTRVGDSNTLSSIESKVFTELQHGGPFIALGAQFADLNGDGRTDLIYQGTDNRFWLSTSTSTDIGAPNLVVTHGGSYFTGGVQYADLNGDGRADQIYQGLDNQFWVSLSNGNGLSAPQLWAQQSGGFYVDGAHYADLNGDGRDDLVYRTLDNRFLVSLSTGSGFSAAQQWVQHGGSFNAG